MACRIVTDAQLDCRCTAIFLLLKILAVREEGGWLEVHLMVKKHDSELAS